MSYHEEQEALDNLKGWWARWGNAITWALLAGLVALAAWNGWNYWQRRQTAGAAVLYDQLQQAAANGKTIDADARARVARVASDLENTFGRTPYAQMTALEAGAVLYRGGEPAGAESPFQVGVDH